MLREIRLYGEMGRRFGREHHFDIATPAEALRALRANYGSPFDQYLLDHRDDPFRVLVGDEPSDMPRMLEPFGHETLRIVPVIHGGSKGSAALQILVGAALIYFSGPIGAGIGGTLGLSAGATIGLQGAIGYLGWSLALGGVAQMLIRPPETSKPSERLSSYSFAGPVNTSAEANCIPVGYGRLIVGSGVISAAVHTDSPATGPGQLAGPPYGLFGNIWHLISD